MLSPTFNWIEEYSGLKYGEHYRYVFVFNSSHMYMIFCGVGF